MLKGRILIVSVTQRIKQVTQPYGGYLPKKLFKYHKFPTPKIKYDKSVATTVGLVVDYLSRYMVSSFSYDRYGPSKAFHISILGSRLAGKEKEIKFLLKNVNRNLDDKCIISACKIVQYDCYVRGTQFTRVNEEIEINSETIIAIREMVYRVVSILKNNTQKLLKFELTFPCCQDQIVKQGDADFLTDDTLWDIKVTDKVFDSKYSLQILMYYLKSLRSSKKYTEIKYLALYSPLTDEIYYINVNDISNKIKYEINNQVFGFKLSDSNDYSKWNNISYGLDYEVIQNFYELQNSESRRTNFDINHYGNGIFRISINDYCSYYSIIDSNIWNAKFSNTEYIILIKKYNFYSFLSVSSNGKLSMLRGARKTNLNHSIKYYYDYLEIYCKRIINIFKSYWDILFEYSNQLKQLEPDQSKLLISYTIRKMQLRELGVDLSEDFDEFFNKHYLLGRVHGCIIDLDLHNHLYLDPLKGQIECYFAESMVERKYYKSVSALLQNEIPYIHKSYQNKKNKFKKIEDKAKNLSASSTKLLGTINKIQSDNILNDNDTIFRSDTDIYKISNLLYGLQRIYTHGIVQIWNDAILIGADPQEQEQVISN